MDLHKIRLSPPQKLTFILSQLTPVSFTSFREQMAAGDAFVIMGGH